MPRSKTKRIKSPYNEGAMVEKLVEPPIDRNLQTIKSPTTDEEVKEEVAKKSDIEIMQDWLNDESNKKMLREQAYTASKILKNWFDLQRFIKKTKWKTIDQSLQILNLFKLAGHLEARVIGKPGRRVEKYKFILEPGDRKLCLEEVLKEIEQGIKYFENEKLKIQKEIEQLTETTE